MRDLAATFKALSDETRLRMLWLLMSHAELCVCDFMVVLGISQSKASRHLRTLFRAGLVEDRRDGLWNHYKLRRSTNDLVSTQLRALRKALVTRDESRALLESLETWLASKQCPPAPSR